VGDFGNRTEPIATPEWAVASRRDSVVDERLGGGWGTTPSSVSRGSAYTDFVNKTMSVPEGDSDIARAIRFHELAHARYSPVDVPAQLCDQLGLLPQTIRIAEEMRVNLLTGTLDSVYPVVRSGTDHATRDEIASLTRGLQDGTEQGSADFANANKDFRHAVNLMYATYGLDVFRTVKRRLKLNKEWADAIEGIAKHLKNTYPLATRWSAGYAGGTKPIAYRYVDRRTICSTTLPDGFVDFTLDVAQDIENIVNNGGAPSSRSKYRPGEEAEKPGDDPSATPSGVAVESGIAWESLRFGMTSLTESCTSFLGRRKRPSMTGKVPRRPDRLLTDPERRIFSEVVRSAGGIVVLDCSGSMGVDHETVRKTTELYAGATVLAYSTRDSSTSNAFILADGGRMISKDEMDSLVLNRGNGCDGPALRWAVRKRRKGDFILWVSDFGVTGERDNQDQGLEADCAQIVLRNGIIQVESCSEAIELLGAMKRTNRVPHGQVSNRRLRELMDQLSRGAILPPTVPVVNIR
jgi:hypothetical protein